MANLTFHPIALQHMEHVSDYQHDRATSPPAHTEQQHTTPDNGGASTAFEALPQPQHEDPIQRRNASAQHSIDLENGECSVSDDPYHLSTKLKSPDEINNIRKDISHKPTIGSLAPSKTASKARKVQKYYESQNENIERLLKPVSEHVREAKSENEANHGLFNLIVNGSLVVKICLAVLQLYAAISSSSLALYATMADALFDPLSNVMLILCARAIKKVDPRKFPSGRARIETAGNIVFCFMMCSVSLILIAFSARDLAVGSPTQTNGFHLPAVISVGIAFAANGILFLICWSLRNKYSQIRILWEDDRNDLLINGFGLLTSIGGSKLVWWVDPMGAIMISCIILGLWLKTAYSEFQLLIGVSADTSMLQLITYISMTHSKDILALDTVRAWHSGPRLIVEVDIVMDANETLRETHDMAEELQMKLESLPEVERAYVHVDYETSHAPEHFLKKEL